MGTKNSCKTATVMGLIGRGPAAEAAPPMPVERARDIETITSEILDAKRAGGEAILTIGKGLIEAKALLSHGEWLPWLTEKVEFSESSAQRFMRLAREWSNPSTLTDLGASKALQLLALPEAEREEFLGETHEVNGEEKAVIDMSARELAQAIKERDEALKAAAQAQADQTAAEQSRKKMAEDMALANERISGLNAEVEAQSAKAREAQDAAARLEKELNELRSRPVDVAVESDPAAIEAARKEAETAMQDKLNEARAAQEKARADLMEVNNALQRAKLEQEQTRSELEALRAKTAQAEKKASLAANEDFVLFHTLFDQVQDQINKMGGVLLKMRPKDPEKGQGMARALTALAEKIQGVAAQ